TTVDAPRRRWLRSSAMGMVYQDAARGLDLGVSAGGNIAERLLAADWRHVGRIRHRGTRPLGRGGRSPQRMGRPAGPVSGGPRARAPGGLAPAPALGKGAAKRPPPGAPGETAPGLGLNRQAANPGPDRGPPGQLGGGIGGGRHDLGVIRLLAHRTLVMYRG